MSRGTVTRGTLKATRLARARHRLTNILAWLLCGLSGCLCATLEAQEADAEVLSSMWRHGLTQAAINYAESRLRVSDSPQDQARWFIQLVECHAQAALRDPSIGDKVSAAERHWRTAREMIEKFTTEQPEHPRLPWVQWQAARLELLEAQAALVKHLAAPGNRKLREQTLALVRSALADTEQLADELQRLIPLAAREGTRNVRYAPVQELHRLAVDVVLLECEALLVRMRLYEPGSPDSVAAATEIDTRSQTILNRTGQDAAAAEPVAVARAIAQWELGIPEKALQELERLARTGTSDIVRRRAAVVAIEQLARQGKTSRAQPLLSLLEGLTLGGSPEAELARMQLVLAELKRAAESQRTAIIGGLVRDAQSLGEKYGAYWRNRAEALLVEHGSNSGAAGGATPELMLAEIRQLLAAGQTQPAIDRLLEFRDAEAGAGRGDSAVRWALQAAALLQREQQWQASIDAVESAVEQFTTAVAAPRAHRQLVWAHAQLLRETASEARKASYEAAMRRQLRVWPDSEESDDVQQWLTSWLVGNKRHAELIQGLQARAAAASDAEVRGRVTLSWLELFFAPDFVSDDKLREELLSLPIDPRTLERVARLFARVLDEWPDQRRQAELSSELTEVARSLPSVASPEEQSVTPGASQANGTTEAAGLGGDSEQAVARRLWQAAEAVASMRSGDAGWLPTADGFAWLEEEWPTALRGALARSLLEALDELSHEQQQRWRQAWMKMQEDGPAWYEQWGAQLVASQDAVEQAVGWRLLGWRDGDAAAIEQLSRLVEQHPRNGRLRLLLSQQHAAQAEGRRDLSNRYAAFVIANTPAGSELNLAGRWQLLKNKLREGDRAAAAELAKLLLASQPLPPSIWRERFENAASSR